MKKIVLNRRIKVCEDGEIYPTTYEPDPKGNAVEVTDKAFRIAIEEGWGRKPRPPRKSQAKSGGSQTGGDQQSSS